MANINHRSRIKEKSKSGGRNTIIYSGTREEMEKIEALNEYGTINPEIGRVSSTRLYQAAALFWELEVVCELQQGEAATPPDTAFGKKSAELHSSTLQMPLAANPEYVANWDHFLFINPATKAATPNWWKNIIYPMVPSDDAGYFAWGKSPAEAPETNGVRWVVKETPVKKGMETWDASLYSLNISARFSDFNKACRMVEKTLNKVRDDPGIKVDVGPGNWKCDAVDVAWHEKYWLAAMTWTKSGDSKGWDKIYEHAF